MECISVPSSVLQVCFLSPILAQQVHSHRTIAPSTTTSHQDIVFNRTGKHRDTLTTLTSYCRPRDLYQQRNAAKAKASKPSPRQAGEPSAINQTRRERSTPGETTRAALLRLPFFLSSTSLPAFPNIVHQTICSFLSAKARARLCTPVVQQAS